MTLSSIEQQGASTVTLFYFRLGSRMCAVPVEVIASVQDQVRITHLPKAARMVAGLANIRGSIIPVLDLRRCFSEQTAGEAPVLTVGRDVPMVIFEVARKEASLLIGGLVDELGKIVRLSSDGFSDGGGKGQSGQVKGLARLGDEPLYLLDTDALFRPEQLSGEETA